MLWKNSDILQIFIASGDGLALGFAWRDAGASSLVKKICTQTTVVT